MGKVEEVGICRGKKEKTVLDYSLKESKDFLVSSTISSTLFKKIDM